MNKAVMISIRPEWCALIAEGKKTVEVRKTKPNAILPLKVYIYCTTVKSIKLNDYVQIHSQTNGMVDEWSSKVIGEFVCDKIDKIRVFENGTVQFWMLNNLHNSCLEYDELADYIGWGKHGYGWHISGLVIYDKPKALQEFFKPCPNDGPCALCKHAELAPVDELLNCENRVQRPPQSWCYVEALK